MVIDGIFYGLGFMAGGLLVSYWTRPAFGIPLFLLALFCMWFFRDPERHIPSGPVAVSPADGRIVVVRPENDGTHIAIFLNVFDVHVNRSPIAGRVSRVDYTHGEFLVASRDDATHRNERNTIVVEGEGSRIRFAQVAGLIARRIVCWKKPGDTVARGERVGLIKFGSRVDIWLGPEWEPAVAPGQRVSAGSSILAKRRGA